MPLYVASAILTLGEGGFILLVPPYMHGRHVPEVAIGAAISIYGVVSLVSRIPAGAIYRSHRAWWLIAAGCLVSSLAFAGITRTAHPALLTFFVALDGAGFAIASTANMAALIDRRPAGANAGSIMGWYTGSLGAGYAVAGFAGGALGDALGPGDAILVLALVPIVAAASLSTAVRSTAPERTTVEPSARGAWWRDFRHVPSLVWLAFFVTLYINLVSGVLLTFFPIYGLAIGLSLTQIGMLQGVHGGAAAVVRFLSAPVFRVVSYQRVLPTMVVLSGISIATIGGVTWLGALVVAWGGLGLTRGLLRVASAALVMDAAGETDAQRGAASGIYLAGLDLGKIVGPVVGGAGAGTLGLRTTFLLASVCFPAVYFVLAALTRRREGRVVPALSSSDS